MDVWLEREMINGLFFLCGIISHVINVLVIQQVHIGTVFDFQAVSLVKTLTRLLTYICIHVSVISFHSLIDKIKQPYISFQSKVAAILNRGHYM